MPRNLLNAGRPRALIDEGSGHLHLKATCSCTCDPLVLLPSDDRARASGEGVCWIGPQIFGLTISFSAQSQQHHLDFREQPTRLDGIFFFLFFFFFPAPYPMECSRCFFKDSAQLALRGQMSTHQREVGMAHSGGHWLHQ